MKSLPAIVVLSLVLITTIFAQNYSWRYYTTGNTGIQGDYVEGIWIDHDGDPYIAAYNPSWEEGGFSKYIQSENKWINYSNVDYPVIGNINDVGASRISDIEEDANGILWMAHWRGLLKFDPAIGGSSIQFWGANNSIHPGGRSRDLAIAPDGSIWIAVVSVTWGDGGLVHYNPATNQWRYWGYGSTANNWPPLIPFLINVSIQTKPNGGYLVWASYESIVVVFDSDTQLFIQLPPSDALKLPGHDCVDDLNNLWAVRVASPGIYSLDYKTQSGNWVIPAQPPVASLINDIWTFKAYGNGNALLIDGNSELWQFNGTSWQSLGIWRQGGFSYGIDIDSIGNIWVTGIGGAAKLNAATGQWQRHRITNSSQIDYWVNDITMDTQGNVWMTGNAGPGVGGFQMFDGTRWIGYNNENYGLGHPFPFPTDNSEAIYFRPSNGQIVVNPMFGFLHSWNGSSYSSLNYPHDRSEGLVEDSQGRLWSLGEYYNLKYYNDAANTWTSVPFDGWGYKIAKDPTRPGTIWASSGFQVLRTDGVYSFTRFNTDFAELDPQSDLLTTVAAAPNGIAWVGSNKGLIKLNANNGTYQFFSPQNSQIPGENISPLLVTDDGRLWFANFGSNGPNGLCWFDGTNFGIIPQRQIGGLPHAQIYDMEVKYLQTGYELWISCASRGIAVLTVTGTIVPVELISFTAAANGNSVNLNWSTSTETNNSGFEIERAGSSTSSNLNWEKVGLVSGNGTTTEFQSYSFSDNNLASGKYLYRLKQFDFDGTYEYSNEVEVVINVPDKFELLQNYPNPFNPSTIISFNVNADKHVSLKIFNSLGEEIITLVNNRLTAGKYDITFNATGLSSGVYLYKLESADEVQIKKMLLLK